MNSADGVWSWLTTAANWSGDAGLAHRVVQHLELTGLAVAFACLIGLPVALILGHVGRGGALAVNLGNVGRALPVVAIMALLGTTWLGITTTTTVIALTFFAIPPVLTHTYTGMRQVDPDAVEAGRGMGMSARQLLFRVEVPMAAPLIIAGVRSCVVQVIGTATVAGLTRGGGLGRTITAGFNTQNTPQVIGAAILVAVLAVLAEILFGVLGRVLDPVGRASRAGRARFGGVAVRYAIPRPARLGGQVSDAPSAEEP